MAGIVLFIGRPGAQSGTDVSIRAVPEVIQALLLGSHPHYLLRHGFLGIELIQLVLVLVAFTQRS